MNEEIRDLEAAERFAGVSLTLCRLTEHLWLLDRLWDLQMELLRELGGAFAPGLILDLGRIFVGDGLEYRGQPLSEALEPHFERYEDHVLGRLSRSRRLTPMIDAINATRADDRVRRLAAALARVLVRIPVEKRIGMSPGLVRRLQSNSADRLRALGRESLDVDPRYVQGALAQYDALVDGLRRSNELISAADLFLVQHLEFLPGRSERLAVEQAVAAAERLGRALPARMKPSGQKSVGGTLANLEDDDRYPIGGFSAISTSGAMENLVSSELVYMDANAQTARQVDLFDMRYVEGELLYYTRDEAVFVRRRRRYVWVFDPSLARARFKDPGLQEQRIVLLLAMVSVFIERLTDWLGEDDLRFSVRFIKGGASPTLAGELGLLQVLLRDHIDAGRLDVALADDLDEVARDIKQDSGRAEVDAQWFEADETLGWAPETRPGMLRWSRASFATSQPAIVPLSGLSEANTDDLEVIDLGSAPVMPANDDSELIWYVWRGLAKTLLQRMIDGP